jgi:hypothetical protein
MAKDSSDQYGKDESEKRMTAALRGARLAKPKPLASIPLKRPKTATQKRRAAKPKK